MRRVSVITAITLVASLACFLSAQHADSLGARNNPFDPRVDRATRHPDSVRAEQRISAASAEFVKTLTNAVEQSVISEEDADRLVKEVEAQFALKRARIDLIRAASLLKNVGESASGLSGSEELQRLNQQLHDLQKGMIIRAEDLRRGQLDTQSKPTLAPQPIDSVDE